MPDEQLARLQAIVQAPSPVGLEGAMSHGVIKDLFEEIAPPAWAVRTFQGSASIVLDTNPDAEPEDDLFTLMLVGHADKIRMQVRSVGADGKVWINSDSFLPLTLLGNEVTLFSEDPGRPGEGAYRRLQGGTVEALGAIHFASAGVRSGAAGIKADQLYLELGLHGSPAERKAQVEALGIRPGDSLLLQRDLVRGFGEDTVVGPYLDNGAGCFVVAEVARLAAAAGLLQSGWASKVRVIFAIASHEEIGRFGSRVLAATLKPDALIAVDGKLNHDKPSSRANYSLRSRSSSSFATPPP
jgi:endoglucanase